MTEPTAKQELPHHVQPPAEPEIAQPPVEEELPPEPLTPERVSEWNAYYDLYVMLAALLLVLATSCNYITDSNFWLHLKSGELIAEHSGPVTADPFSYTQPGKEWVNLSWLFDWAQAALYHTAYGLVPVNPADPTANKATAEQIGVGTLGAFAAILRLLTAWIVLKIRHRGPGLWWSALCTTLALGVAVHPLFGITLGGLAGPGAVSPTTWGLLFLALELFALHRAAAGRSLGLWLLVPLFALWSNVDDLFLIGLVVLAAAAVGRLIDGRKALAFPEAGQDAAPPPPIAASRIFLALGLGALACLANPFTYKAYLAALEPYISFFQPTGSISRMDHLSFFGPELRKLVATDDWYRLMAFYLLTTAIGLASFLLNSRRFVWSRFLPYAVLAALWAMLMRTTAPFALVLAITLALNGQEWYLDRLGARGRLGALWTLWSTGGRLLTLTLLFAMVAMDITGWGNALPEIQFGLGFQADDFVAEAAAFLEAHPEIQGNILNTSLAQGDMIVWKTGGMRKVYIDGRARFFPRPLLEEWNATRKAISEDDIDAWKPLLDKYDISAVLIEPGPGGSPNTYKKLMTSPNWTPFHDDGRIVMFGRADAPKTDVALFETNRLDPDHLAYKSNRPVPNAERPPNPTSWMDDVFQGRTFSRPRSRTESARRWLEGLGGPVSASESLPDPARCLLAIHEARTALAQSPDDWIAFRRLKDAYRYLMLQEGAMLAGIPITPANGPRIRALNPPLEPLMNRYRQRVTALNYAVLTTPPPQSDPARRELQSLNLELFQLYLGANALDLARDRLQLVLDGGKADDFPAEARAQFEKDLAQLNERIKKLEDDLENLSIERQASSIQQASYALSQGGAGWAIGQLAEAERGGVSPAVVKPQLIDLYCNTGQPDKALELLSLGSTIDDPNLGSEPGTAALRQGQVYFLLGNYVSAATLWLERAIPRVRFERSMRALTAGQALTRGEAVGTSNAFIGLPSTLGQQASWEYDAAMCLLESGLPDQAATHFTSALKLFPDLPVRAIAAYYLEKMGKPVPPPTKKPAANAKTPLPTPGAPVAPKP